MPKQIAAADVSYDKIHRWVLAPDDENVRLTKQDRAIFNRWDFADTQLRRFPRKKQVAEVLRKKYKYSISTAYSDIYNAQRLFASIHPLNKEWIRNYLIEDIFVLLEAAKKSGNMKAWGVAQANLIKAAGLEKIDEEKIDPEILDKHNFYVMINIGKQVFKVDLETFQNLPVNTKNKIISEIDQEITEIEAAEILES
jgi:hypothetical protein